jgi:ABC-type transport system involved in cytochrome c biogenesis ATPase subunit
MQAYEDVSGRISQTSLLRMISGLARRASGLDYAYQQTQMLVVAVSNTQDETSIAARGLTN